MGTRGWIKLSLRNAEIPKNPRLAMQVLASDRKYLALAKSFVLPQSPESAPTPSLWSAAPAWLVIAA